MADNGHLYEIQLNTEPFIIGKAHIPGLYKIAQKLETEDIPDSAKKPVETGIKSIMDNVYWFAAELARRGVTPQRMSAFRTSLSGIMDDSIAILNFLDSDGISHKLSSSMRNILSSFRSKAKSMPSDRKKTRSDESGASSAASTVPGVAGKVVGTDDTSKVEDESETASTLNIPTKGPKVKGSTGTAETEAGRENNESSEIDLLGKLDYSLDVRRAHEEIQRRVEKGETSEEAARSLRGKSTVESVFGPDGEVTGQGPTQKGSEGEVTERGPPTQPEPIPKERTGAATVKGGTSVKQKGLFSGLEQDGRKPAAESDAARRTGDRGAGKSTKGRCTKRLVKKLSRKRGK